MARVVSSGRCDEISFAPVRILSRHRHNCGPSRLLAYRTVEHGDGEGGRVGIPSVDNVVEMLCKFSEEVMQCASGQWGRTHFSLTVSNSLRFGVPPGEEVANSTR